MTKLEKQDKVNTFYKFEELAKDPKSANRLFLIIPKDEDKPSGRTEWTYAEAYDTVLKYARWLKEVHGVQRHEVIAMDFKNKPQFIWMWFALWSLGAIPAFINSNLEDKAFIHCVKVSTSRLLVLDPEIENILTEEALREFGPDDKGRAVESVILRPGLELEIERLLTYRAPDEARSGVERTSPALLIYTSGTTGLPKAANVVWYVHERQAYLAKPTRRVESRRPASLTLHFFCPGRNQLWEWISSHECWVSNPPIGT